MTMEDAIFPSKQSRKPNSSLPKKINNQNKERKAIDIARIRDGRRGEVWLKGVGESQARGLRSQRTTRGWWHELEERLAAGHGARLRHVEAGHGQS